MKKIILKSMLALSLISTVSVGAEYYEPLPEQYRETYIETGGFVDVEPTGFIKETYDIIDEHMGMLYQIFYLEDEGNDVGMFLLVPEYEVLEMLVFAKLGDTDALETWEEQGELFKDITTKVKTMAKINNIVDGVNYPTNSSLVLVYPEDETGDDIINFTYNGMMIYDHVLNKGME